MNQLLKLLKFKSFDPKKDLTNFKNIYVLVDPENELLQHMQNLNLYVLTNYEYRTEHLKLKAMSNDLSDIHYDNMFYKFFEYHKSPKTVRNITNIKLVTIEALSKSKIFNFNVKFFFIHKQNKKYLMRECSMMRI